MALVRSPLSLQYSQIPTSMAHLPSWGFSNSSASAPKFADLVKTNAKLYRIYSDQSISPLTKDGFIAGRYLNVRYRLPDNLADIPDSYSDAVNRIGKWEISDSQYISTTFSFIYAVWEANRRESRHSETGVHIAIIDSHSVLPHALTGLEALEHLIPDKYQRPLKEHQAVKNFTNAESEVLVKGRIPPTAIEATIPFPQLVRLLPSFYKRHTSSNDVKLIFDYKVSFSQIWNADTDLQSAFHMFERTKRKLIKRRETGVNLAIAILDPQDQHTSHCTNNPGEYTDFVSRVSALAFDLAHFPSSSSEARELASSLKLDDIVETVRDTLLERKVQNGMNEVIERARQELESRVDSEEEVEAKLADIMSGVTVRI